ncbi:FtsX-like permease family protein [Bacteroidota bacterium]
MLKNYFTIMIRNMVRNKLFTMINIFGLSVSLACCILLFLYATRELSYDTHHGESVYRITAVISQKDGEEFKLATTSIPIAPTIQQEIPEIEFAARAISGSLFGSKNLISYEENSWYIEDGYISDTSIFEILKFDIIKGNKENPLTHNDAIVLEKDWAKTIFGEDDPIGKIVKVSTDFGEIDFDVTAIYDKTNFNTHLTPTFFVSMANASWNSFFNQDMQNWVGNNMVFSYVKLLPGSDPTQVDEKIHELLLMHGGEMMKETGLNKEMDLQPIREVHTTEGYMVNIQDTTNLTFIRVLVMIGILILILACVNYINLATAQAGNRALEIGIRKVMGVTPRGLIIQLLGESFMIVLCSLVLSFLLAQLGLGFFNQLIDNPLAITSEFFGILALYSLGFLIITGLVAGFYPALYLSRFKPTEVLKGRGKEQSGTSWLRKILVVLQFVISIGLITAIIIISKQVDYIKNKELGFDAGTKVVIPLETEEAGGQYDILRDKYKSLATVNNVSGADGIPGSPILNDLLVYKQGQTMDDAIHIYNNSVDLDFVQLMGMELRGGSFFMDYNKDSTRSKILISETGINMLGISPDDAQGEIVYFDWEGQRMEHEIVGVVNDIHQFSLHQDIDPIMYTIGDGKRYQYLVIDGNLENFQALLSQLEDEWKSVIHNTPFSYFTLSDHLMVQYEADFNTFNLIKYFAIISILISCLGLYAMSMFMAERRYREIGIRKAFGAGVRNIVVMVSGELFKLILISFILSIPISIFAMNKWLETFAYRISPGVGSFIIAGFISILIAWITISYQSARAAGTNPVDVLREE